ncbi:MAG: hypothetical protein C4518_01530, partial [Desulfobacteraceae bacterium]
MNSNEIDIENLHELYEQHYEIGELIYSCCNGNVYPMDLYTFSALDRSLHNLAGFQLLLKEDNYLCALPVLRMQLDTLMRYWAFLLVDDAHDFAYEIFCGKPVKKIKDRKNKYLTDLYIVENIKKLNPWIEQVYKVCCSYVHFSDSHIRTLIANSPVEAESNSRMLTFSFKDSNIPKEDKMDVIIAFNPTTQVNYFFLAPNPFFGYITQQTRKMEVTHA